MPRAKLEDILTAIEASSEVSFAYVDRRTGQVVVITDEDRDLAEDPRRAADAPAWQKECIDLARTIAADTAGRFVALPDKFDVHEWEMMSRFVRTISDRSANEDLQHAIHGAGAFRRFKDTAARLGLLDQWFAFREERYRDLARTWCEQEGIELDERP